jgi:hypothetical protein
LFSGVAVSSLFFKNFWRPFYLALAKVPKECQTGENGDTLPPFSTSFTGSAKLFIGITFTRFAPV